MKNSSYIFSFVRFVTLAVALVGVTGSVMAISYPVYGAGSRSVASVPMMDQRANPMPEIAMLNAQVSGSGSAYASSVYSPFTAEVPSDASNPAPQSGPQQRRGFILGPDDDPANQSPVGEPWILAAFAALFAFAIGRKVRNKKQENCSSVNLAQNNDNIKHTKDMKTINLFSWINPDGQPTVSRRSTDGQRRDHYAIGLTKLLCTLTLLLTLGVGQMWAATIPAGTTIYVDVSNFSASYNSGYFLSVTASANSSCTMTKDNTSGAGSYKPKTDSQWYTLSQVSGNIYSATIASQSTVGKITIWSKNESSYDQVWEVNVATATYDGTHDFLTISSGYTTHGDRRACCFNSTWSTYNPCDYFGYAPSEVVSGTNVMFYFQGYASNNYLTNGSGRTAITTASNILTSTISYANIAKTDRSTYYYVSNNVSGWNGNANNGIKTANGGELFRADGTTSTTAAKTATTTTSVTGETLSISTTTNATQGVYASKQLYIQYYVDNTFAGVTYSGNTAVCNSITAGGATARTSTFNVSSLTNGSHTLKTILTDGIVYYIADEDNFNVAHSYSITYKDQGNVAYSGDNSASLPSSYTYGVGATLVDGVKAGYDFGGWYTASDCSSGLTTSISTSATGNKTFYAKWTLSATNSLTVVAGTGISSVTGSTDPVTLGSKYNISATVATGYTFNTWTESPAANGTFDNASQASTKVKVVNGSVAVTATATENMSTLSTSCHYDAGNPSYAYPTVSNSATNVGYSTTRTITATDAGTGYTFAGWTLTNCTRTDGGAANATSITIRSNGDGAAATVVANYEEVLTQSVWVVRGDAQFGNTWGANTNAMSKKTGHANEDVVYYTVTTTGTNTGNENVDAYQFKIYNTSTGKWYGLDATGDTYHIKRTESGTAKTLCECKNMELKADVVGPYELKVDYSTPASPVLTVTFPTSYSLTYSVGSVAGNDGNISTSPSTSSGSQVISGNTVTLTAPAAKAGYSWKGWYTNAAGTEGKITDTNRAITVTMNSDKTLYACFTENDYTVTVTAGEHGSVASGSVTGHVATKVTLPTATPEVGYYFTGWTTTTGTVTYTNQSSATSAQVNGLTAPATVQANFARTYAYIQGRMTVYNSARSSETHTASAKGGWDEGSTRIEMTFDETNHEFYRHTYKTPAELKALIGGNDQWFSIATSTTSGSMANKKTYHPSSDNQDLTTAGTQYATQTSTTTYNYRFNNSTTDGYAILHFNESKVWYTLEHTLKYNANGGTGSAPASATYYGHGVNATAAANTYTRTGYNFSGWKTEASGGTSYAAGANVPMNSNITLYAQWTPKQTTVSFNANTSAEGYGSGSAPSSVTANFGVAMPSISIGVTAQNGYGCIGYFDDPVNGTQYYDGTGASVKNWDKDVATATLYAHYKKAQITAQTFSPSSIVAPNTALTVTVTVDPTPTGSTYICWRLLQNNGNPLASQPDFTWNNTTKQLTFNAPATGGTYKLEAVLRLGGNDCSGTVLDKDTANLVVANDHTVTVLYRCGDATIKSSTEAPAKPLVWTSITAPDIVGYTFSKWKAGDGVTIEDADANGEKASATINYKAIYDGSLTAIYTQKRMIYFYNTLGWSSVYVYFYKNDSYWQTVSPYKGSGANTSYTWTGTPYSEGKHGQMLPVSEGSNIYYFDAEAAGVNASYDDVVFTEHQQHGYDYFYQTNAARRGDYKSSMPMFVPLAGQTAEVHNQTNYYNHGYWMNYPENTGYTLRLYRTPEANNATEASREYLIPYSADKKMPLKQDVEINFSGETWFLIYRNDGKYLEGSSGHDTFKQSDHDDEVITSTADAGSAYKLKVISDGEGIYTFNLSYHDDGAMTPTYNYYINVDFPAAVGDYRIVYKDNATWSQGAPHSASWYHPSKIITKIKAEATEAKKDTVSFFISYGSSPSMKFQKIKSINASTGAITWEDVSGGSITIPSSITEAGVYNFIISQSVDGTSISVEKAEPYTGQYYIRTDNAGNTKWDNYKSLDHQMTYTEFSRNRSTNTFGELYTHYYAHWCERGSNIQFVIANDYSPCISDTLAQDVDNPYNNTDAAGTLNIEDLSKLPVNDRYSANVRFMYNETTNKICRAYVASSTDLSRLFLVLRGNDEVRGDDDDPISDQDITNGVILDDKQNWIYERTLRILPGTRFKLFACYAEATPSQSGAQYFRGAYASDQFTTDANSVILVDGNPSVGYQNVRVIYDFKTNRLVSAWLPDNSSINGDLPIHADVMVIREHQEAAKQITFANAESKLSQVLTVYGAMKFNRWVLNNKSTAAGHAVLPPSDQKSIYERALYFISFPFDVNLSEVFGFGTYGKHWIIEYYDGLNRAKNGYWIDSPPNWKYVTNPNGYILEAKKGYILCLDLDEMKDDNEDFWSNNIETIELFFPSTTTYGTIQQTTATTPALGEEYRCTINRGDGTEGDRRIKDSFWRCIGVPSFANYSSTLSNGSGTITWQTGNSLPYLYEWNMTDNSLTAQGTSTYNFKAMHAYLAQCQSSIVWTATSSKPSVAARRNDSETLRDREFRLQLDENGVKKDQAFVRLSMDEAVTAGFEFGNDLSKEQNAKKSNIYTMIDGYLQAAANSLPLSTTQTTIVPVGIVANANADYTFSMPDGTDGVGVTLIDNETGTRTSLSALDYTVTLSKGTYNDRFVLEISAIQQTPTGVDELQADDVQDAKVRKLLIDQKLFIIRDGKMYDARGALITR